MSAFEGLLTYQIVLRVSAVLEMSMAGVQFECRSHYR